MAAAQGPATRERKDMSYYFIVTVSLSSDADTPYDSYIREVKPIVENTAANTWSGPMRSFR